MPIGRDRYIKKYWNELVFEKRGHSTSFADRNLFAPGYSLSKDVKTVDINEACHKRLLKNCFIQTLLATNN